MRFLMTKDWVIINTKYSRAQRPEQGSLSQVQMTKYKMGLWSVSPPYLMVQDHLGHSSNHFLQRHVGQASTAGVTQLPKKPHQVWPENTHTQNIMSQ